MASVPSPPCCCSVQNLSMPSNIRVPSPEPGEDLRLYFDEMVENDRFGLSLDYSVTEFDELARLAGITVTGAEVSDAGVAVRYTASWEAFHACDAKTVGGEHTRVVRGSRESTDWVFERTTPLSARSTVDEF